MKIQPPNIDESCFDFVITQLIKQRYAIIDNLLPANLLSDLDRHFQSLHHTKFKHAGVGRDERFQTNHTIRNDVIYWPEQNINIIKQYLSWMEALRQRVNREFLLGLFDYECHYAHFPEESFYKRHVDAFKGQSNRRLSTILYLNHDWKKEDGGLLRMYHDSEEQPFIEVLPEYGRMLFFFSEQFPHEVSVAKRSRRSITGWFRLNSSHSKLADPIC